MSNVDPSGGFTGASGAMWGAGIGFVAGTAIAKLSGESWGSSLAWGTLGAGLGAGIGYGWGESMTNNTGFWLNFRGFYEGLVPVFDNGDHIVNPRFAAIGGRGAVDVPSIWSSMSLSGLSFNFQFPSIFSWEIAMRVQWQQIEEQIWVSQGFPKGDKERYMPRQGGTPGAYRRDKVGDVIYGMAYGEAYDGFDTEVDGGPGTRSKVSVSTGFADITATNSGGQTVNRGRSSYYSEIQKLSVTVRQPIVDAIPGRVALGAKVKVRVVTERKTEVPFKRLRFFKKRS